MKKPQGTVDEGETTIAHSPLRKLKSMEGTSPTTTIKQKVLKFHQEMVRGINIVRSMGLNNEKYTPLFSYFIFKTICEKMKKFKQEELTVHQNVPDIKQYRQIFDSETDDLDYEIAMLRNKV